MSSEPQEEPTFAVLVSPPAAAAAAPIRLDGLSAADTVLSLRQLLAEYPALATYTCYRLEVQTTDDATWLALNDFVELGEYEAVTDGAVLRMVLEKYDARKVRNHVRRFRDVLLNPPIPQAAEVDAEPSSETTNGTENEAATEETAKETELDKKAQKELAEKQLQHLREIHEKLDGVQIPVPNDLGEFYAMPLASNSKKSESTTSPKKKGGKKGGKKQNEQAEKAKKDEDFSLETAKLPQCIKSIVFSGYNPPPGPRKLAGDLLYLEVTTEDDAIFYVTAHVNGFYVNRSTTTKFDPLPLKADNTEHLLLDVLLKSSNKFKSSYDSLLTKAAALAKQGPVSIEWMVAAGNQIGGKLPWNTPVNSAKHEYNLNRAEDELCASFGMDERGVLRDWNEEYQCCRELPAESLKDQIIRSRVMYKIVNEFVDAATQGAVAIVEGHIPPINPMDDASAHVYVFNNIFFSLSVDGKPSAKDVVGEEAAFSSANRDLQGVKAFNEADINGLHTLATAVIDYLGTRVIAQSVIPGILQGEAASKLIYGSVDGGKTIASNEKMHKLMLEAGEKLHIAERSIQPLGKDADEQEEEAATGGEAGTAVVKLCGPVEAKGILGSDGRMYVLDLVRITPKDSTFYASREQKETEVEGTRFKRDDDGYVALLRPELVRLYSMWKQNQARKAKRDEKKALEEANKKDEAEKTDENAPKEETNGEDKKEDATEEEEEPVDPVRLNTNVFMKYKASTDDEEATADEAAARDAADYLQKVVIPAFVADVRRGSISPADGYALSELMHSCGINMRYLGRIASLVKKLESVGGISKYVLELLEVEMIARAVKHLVADILNKDESVRAAPGEALVQLLNSILGGWEEEVDDPSTSTEKLSDKNPNKKNKKKTNTKKSVGAVASSDGLDGVSIWKRITTQVKNRFDYNLTLWNPYQSVESSDDDSESAKFKRVYKNVLLRRLSQRLGLRVASKTYDYSSATPFALEDITGVVPVVKHSLPAHPLAHAKQLLERGRLHLSGGALATSYELLQESSNLLFQVVGGAHEDAALCSSSLATVLYHAGDVPGAIAQQQRALALYTQLQGLDYHDTAFAHANLALFLHANSNTDVAVSHLRRAIYLLELCAGPHFPEISTLYLRLGSMCQDVGQISLALLCYRESLQRGEFDRLQAANTLHQMALACSLVGGFRDALTYEKRVYSLLKETFGDEDPRVQESLKLIATFTERAVEGAKGRREVDAASAADAVARELIDELNFEETASKKKNKKGKNKKQ
ncbi:hypothetical protein Poli38472_003315 [Pythium oligandrum]|uniref:Clu domain-containing protein n=1 Tax=Pythium oligandrum TaxID=41045 RepID=A0A8K1FBK8_PYTOL|nr:hypothetical protein Poli38472_003315 [Pythium oligandrum]|eukprot:TMW57390.1 hypothetical protein Poli38472_003315 [Pythium oligandrum]